MRKAQRAKRAQGAVALLLAALHVAAVCGLRERNAYVLPMWHDPDAAIFEGTPPLLHVRRSLASRPERVPPYLPPPCNEACQTQQRVVLLELYASLGGRSWKNRSGWGDMHAHVCSWYGISCCAADSSGDSALRLWHNSGNASAMARESARILLSLSCLPLDPENATALLEASVVAVSLANNNVQGKLDGGVLRGLPELQALNMMDNGLHGTVPWPELAQLTAMHHLRLGRNELTGSIGTELANMTQLYDCLLSYNKLTGSVPSQITRLARLEVLQLNNNQLTGEAPISVIGMERILSIRLSSNRFSGPLPTTLPFPRGKPCTPGS